MTFGIIYLFIYTICTANRPVEVRTPDISNAHNLSPLVKKFSEKFLELIALVS